MAAYITATLLRSEPIYESLLGRILEGQGGRKAASGGGQKVLSEFVVMGGSPLEGQKVMDIDWPDNWSGMEKSVSHGERQS